jgi:hypothetical protein
MPRYEHPDISFEYPRDWEDRSVVAFAAPVEPDKTATNVVLTRDKLAEEETIRGYADRQIVEMSKRLDAFTLIERNDVDGGGIVDLRFAWRGSAGALVQRLVMIPLKEGRIVNLTCTTSREEAQEFAPIFDRILASVRVNG